MLSIAVCDDNMLECCRLSQKVQEILAHRNIICTVKEFFSGKELVKSSQSFDIVLLDIMMEQIDGIAVANALRKEGKNFLLVFVTASKEYMQDAFDVETFHYLVKPVEYARLKRVLLAAHKKLVPRHDSHLIYAKNGYLCKADLCVTHYFESIGRIVKIHQKGKKTVEFYEQFAVLEGKLAGNDFFRCHKSYLVNLSYVARYNKTDIILDDGTRIPLSKRRYREFTVALLGYLKRAGGIL